MVIAFDLAAPLLPPGKREAPVRAKQKAPRIQMTRRPSGLMASRSDYFFLAGKSWRTQSLSISFS